MLESLTYDIRIGCVLCVAPTSLHSTLFTTPLLHLEWMPSVWEKGGEGGKKEGGEEGGRRGEEGRGGGGEGEEGWQIFLMALYIYVGLPRVRLTRR